MVSSLHCKVQSPFEGGGIRLSEARGENQGSEFTKCIVSQGPSKKQWGAWLRMIQGGLNVVAVYGATSRVGVGKQGRTPGRMWVCKM